MREENRRMKAFLKANGIDAEPKFIYTGSLKGTWRLYGKNGPSGYQQWTPELSEKLNALNFWNAHGKPLGRFDGNGGVFSVFVRGHKEFIKGVPVPKGAWNGWSK